MLSYRLVSNGHPKLERRILELGDRIAPLFPELGNISLRVRMKRLRASVAEYDYRYLRIDIDPRNFEPDENNSLPSVLVHETMHAVQYVAKGSVPQGERSCDIFMLSRLPLDLYPKIKDFYVKVPQSLLSRSPETICETAREAIELRNQGTRRYIVWFEEKLREAAKN